MLSFNGSCLSVLETTMTKIIWMNLKALYVRKVQVNFGWNRARGFREKVFWKRKFMQTCSINLDIDIFPCSWLIQYVCRIWNFSFQQFLTKWLFSLVSQKTRKRKSNWPSRRKCQRWTYDHHLNMFCRHWFPDVLCFKFLGYLSVSRLWRRRFFLYVNQLGRQTGTIWTNFHLTWPLIVNYEMWLQSDQAFRGDNANSCHLETEVRVFHLPWHWYIFIFNPRMTAWPIARLCWEWARKSQPSDGWMPDNEALAILR